MAKRKTTPGPPAVAGKAYSGLLTDLSAVVEAARRSAVRAVNVVLTAAYWEVGRRVVEFEQGGKERAAYGEALLKSLAADLTARLGRGFSRQNLQQMRGFYLGWEICQTPSGISQARVRAADEKGQTLSAIFDLPRTADTFPLPWSHYVRLLSVENLLARAFYEEEAIRGSWSVRQLDRQVQALFYERTAVSRNKAAMLTKGAATRPEDAVTTAEQIRDPLVLEFLDLKDEYSEGDLEEAIIRHLEAFLLELGDAFTFVGRQKRLRIDDKWFHVDLVFFHRVLRCLLIVDLKLGAFTHADDGQMHMYLNYAKEYWVKAGENPPVGLILCVEKGHDEARYALEGLGNTVLTSTYRTTLPDEQVLLAELDRTRRALELRKLNG
jgi:predicted nuclease of restriction endonuclease-like (RecB) superfamily